MNFSLFAIALAATLGLTAVQGQQSRSFTVNFKAAVDIADGIKRCASVTSDKIGFPADYASDDVKKCQSTTTTFSYKYGGNLIPFLRHGKENVFLVADKDGEGYYLTTTKPKNGEKATLATIANPTTLTTSLIMKVRDPKNAGGALCVDSPRSAGGVLKAYKCPKEFRATFRVLSVVE